MTQSLRRRSPFALMSPSFAVLATVAAVTTCTPEDALASIQLGVSEQHFGYTVVGNPLARGGSGVGSGGGPIPWSGDARGSYTTGNTPSTMLVEYTSIIPATGVLAGSLHFRTTVNPGISGVGGVGIIQTDNRLSARFSSTEPMTATFAGLSTLTQPQDSVISTSRVLIQRNDADIFRWESLGELNDPGTIQDSITLAPGEYTILLQSTLTITQSDPSLPPPPNTLADFNLNFAIIPAPATLLPFAALPFLTAARRRRPSGR
jgi:hypothetical protein